MEVQVLSKERGACLEARRVRELRLGHLAVVQRAVSDRAARRADREAAAVELVARAVPVLGRLVHDLRVAPTELNSAELNSTELNQLNSINLFSSVLRAPSRKYRGLSRA